ncbi:TORC2 complex subunit TSC11 ASCRUDRAFT_24924, partial [Ascoidea rubescens DSM 1968]
SPTVNISDILSSLSDKSISPESQVQKANDLINLFQNYPNVKNQLVFSQLGYRIQFFLLSKSKEVIAAGFRIARYFISDYDSLKLILSLRIHFFIIISLSKSNPSYYSNIERIQALKLIRKYLDIPNGAEILSVGIVNALLSICDQNDDDLKNIAIETLCELIILNPKLLYQADGFRYFLKIIVDGPFELSPLAGMAVVKLLSSPKSRKYINGYDLNYLLNYFLTYKTRFNIEKLNNSAFLVSSFLKTWSGLIAFCHNDFEPFKILINCLIYNNYYSRDSIMDIFFDILNLRPLPWIKTIDIKINSKNKNSNFYSQSEILLQQSNINKKNTNTGYHTNSPNNQITIINHYTSLILAILMNCNLMDKLLSIAKTTDDKKNKSKAICLIIEIFQLSSNLLPRNYWGISEELVSLIEDNGIENMMKSSKIFNYQQSSINTIFQIETYTRKISKGKTTYNVPPIVLHSLDKLNKDLIYKMAINIDDFQFRKMINDTKVLTTKDTSEWKWDIIIDLANGPLKNPKRFEETLKTTKFIKRLMSFYRPFKKKFSSMKKSKDQDKYINTGCALFKMFLSTSEGFKYLSENKLLPQIAECLAQIDPYSCITANEPIFSKKYLATRLSFGYFKMLAVLSSSSQGISLLSKWNIFTILYHIVERNDRSDIVLTFLPEFNYSKQSHLRIIFSKALTTRDRTVRLYATNLLKDLLRIPSCSKWAINLLIGQLYDTDIEVCNVSVEILDAYCVTPENMYEVLKYRPSLDHLGMIGAPLLLRFLSSPLGFNYLSEFDLIENEMDDWFNRKNDLYVLEIESLLFDEYSPFQNMLDSDGDEDVKVIDDYNIFFQKKILPHHFFGELVKTEEGNELLSRTTYFQSFVNTINALKDECENMENIIKLKGCLWAVGHIALSDFAIELVDKSGIIPTIIYICKMSKIWSLKGTAFFVVGLIANTQDGIECLDEYGWDISFDINNNPIGICLPKNLNEYFGNDKTLKVLDVDSEKNVIYDTSSKDLETSDAIVKKIFTSISYLCVPMLMGQGGKLLNKLRSKYRDKFDTAEVFLGAMNLLENTKYKPGARKFIVELFSNSKAIEALLKKDRRRSKVE